MATEGPNSVSATFGRMTGTATITRSTATAALPSAALKNMFTNIGPIASVREPGTNQQRFYFLGTPQTKPILEKIAARANLSLVDDQPHLIVPDHQATILIHDENKHRSEEQRTVLMTLMMTLMGLPNHFAQQPAGFLNSAGQTWAQYQESQLSPDDKFWRNMAQIGTIVFAPNHQTSQSGTLYVTAEGRSDTELAALHQILQKAAQDIGAHPHQDIGADTHPIKAAGRALTLKVPNTGHATFKSRVISLPNLLVERGLKFINPMTGQDLADMVRQKINTPYVALGGQSFSRTKHYADHIDPAKDYTLVNAIGLDRVEIGTLMTTSGFNVTRHSQNADILVFPGPQAFFNRHLGPQTGFGDLIPGATSMGAAPAPSGGR
jgi:hypothetical protein